VSEFEIIHIARLTGMRLFSAGDVEPEDGDNSKKGANDKLKIQLLFYGRCIKKGEAKIIGSEKIQQVHETLGDGVLAKLKVEEAVFAELYRLGLREGTVSDWDVIPHAWTMPGTKGIKSGTWFQPTAFIRLDGRDMNFQILKSQNVKKPLKNAFERFKNSNNTHSSWSGELGNLEHQINAELEGATLNGASQ
jgi:hypothetical protein